MFGIIADLIASVTSILLPCYLSYKSLRLGDPAQTTPWLIYFIILTLLLMAESWTLFIIGWLPFYSWFRLFFLLYLVLPQTQGAKVFYINYFEPFILHHEKQIDNFIGQAHQRLEQMGLGYMNILVEWIREKILGQASPQTRTASAVPPGAQGYATYASDLMSRFAMPAARTSAASAVSSGAGGMFGMLSSAAGAALAAGAGTAASPASGSARSVPTSAQAASIPENFLASMSSMSSDQKSTFISTQVDRLNAMLKALDKEQQSLDLAYGAENVSRPAGSRRPPSSQSGLFSKSLSQQSFDNIDYDDLHSTGNGSGNGSGYPSQHSTPPTMRQSSGRVDTQRPAGSNWAAGGLGGWLAGSPREETHRSRDDYYDRKDEVPRGNRDERRSPRVSGADEDGYLSRGWSTAREITESIAKNTAGSGGSGRDRDRYER